MVVLPQYTATANQENADMPSRIRAAGRVTEIGPNWSYRLAILFLGFYYIRPQDWLPGLAGFNIVRPLMVAWVMVLMTEGSRSPVRGWFRTPHDWVMLALYAYIVWNAPKEAGATMGMFSLVVFYYLTTQALSSWDRILGYLKAWNIMLITLATFGVLQKMGFDITQAKENTEKLFFGRLTLGTWMANNPNALGHTVVAAIPLSYILYFWRGSAMGRMVIFPTCTILASWCAWYTASKGSFLVGALGLVLCFVIGRPKWIQILVISAALTAGVGALSFMPRMDRMGDLRSDDGVAGRLLAWDRARLSMDRNTYGVGWRQFMAFIDWKEGNYMMTVAKSTHSSYVQVGADLGVYGLFLWLLGIWTAIRSLVFFKSANQTRERCRRAILLLVVSYAASSWMINREYHTEYYLLIAVAAALHRLRLAQEIEDAETASETQSSQSIFKDSSPPHQSSSRSEEEDEVSEEEESLDSENKRAIWKQLGLIDLAAGIAFVYIVVQIWDYVLGHL